MSENQGSRRFRNLLHWQKGQEVALRVMALVRNLPRGRASYLVGAQVLRSAGSVPANIAEGMGIIRKKRTLITLHGRVREEEAAYEVDDE